MSAEVVVFEAVFDFEETEAAVLLDVLLAEYVFAEDVEDVKYVVTLVVSAAEASG